MFALLFMNSFVRYFLHTDNICFVHVKLINVLINLAGYNLFGQFFILSFRRSCTYIFRCLES